MNEIIDKLRGAAADPDSPIYGSNLVPWIADLCEIAERLERVASVALLIQDDDRNNICEFLETGGWSRLDSGHWTHPKHFEDAGSVHPDTAMSLEMDLALNALQKPGG